MIRQAGFVCRACAAHARRQLQWPVSTATTAVAAAARPSPSYHARHSSIATSIPASSLEPQVVSTPIEEAPVCYPDARIIETEKTQFGPPESTRKNVPELSESGGRSKLRGGAQTLHDDGAKKPGWWKKQRKGKSRRSIPPIVQDASELPESEIISMLKGGTGAPNGGNAKTKASKKVPRRVEGLRDSEYNKPVTPTDKRQLWRRSNFKPFLEGTGKLGKKESRQFLEWRKLCHELWRRMVLPSPDNNNPGEHLTVGSEDLAEFLRLSTVSEMRDLYRTKPALKRWARWRDLTVAALYLEPRRAVQVLEATLDLESLKQQHAVPDAFAILCRWSSRLPQDQRTEQLSALSGLMLRLLRDNSPGSFQFSQWVLYDVIQSCDMKTLKELYQELRRHLHPLTAYTRLHIANRFAKEVDYKGDALNILQEIVEANEMDINAPHCAALATAIMTFPKPKDATRRDDTEAQAKALSRTQTEIYERLLRMDLIPNKIHYTAMIRNLCNNQQLPAAWDVYRIMRDQGIKPDAHVYSVLLHGSKIARDIESTKRVILEGSGDSLRETIIWNDLLDTILKTSFKESRHEKGLGRRRAFRAMVRVYQMFFKPEPLERLLRSDLRTHFGSTDPNNEPPNWQWGQEMSSFLETLARRHPEDLVEPGSDTLTIMIIGYLRSAPDLNTLIAFYWHFRSLFKAGDPTVARLLEDGTLIYDAILKLVLEHRGTVRIAFNIISDMLTEAAAYANSVAASQAAAPQAETEAAKSTTVTNTEVRQTPAQPPSAATATTSLPFHPAPSVFTWSVLLYKLVCSNARTYGWRVLKMMGRHGVRPNLVTWNTLIKGFALSKSPTRTSKALFDMERAGFVPNERTYRAFANLRGMQNRALELLEQRTAEWEARREKRAAEKRERERQRRRIQEEEDATTDADAEEAEKEEVGGAASSSSSSSSAFAQRILERRRLIAEARRERERDRAEQRLLLQEEEEFREEDAAWDADSRLLPTSSSPQQQHHHLQGGGDGSVFNPSRDHMHAQSFLQMRDELAEIAEDMRRQGDADAATAADAVGKGGMNWGRSHGTTTTSSSLSSATAEDPGQSQNDGPAPPAEAGDDGDGSEKDLSMAEYMDVLEKWGMAGVEPKEKEEELEEQELQEFEERELRALEEQEQEQNKELQGARGAERRKQNPTS
ncbi:hypothetical protein VTK26DRAFT_126 [Humicola hyalothermophila]